MGDALMTADRWSTLMLWLGLALVAWPLVYVGVMVFAVEGR